MLIHKGFIRISVNNLKQAARTLIYLQENGIDSYDELVKKTVAASCGFNEKLDRMKDIETRQKEISALQYQIGHYGKTRETYKRYIASGRDRDFYEAERADITLHQAAKKYFDEHGYGKNKKLPSINMLKQEWATLETERKKLYHGYRKLKDRRTELIKARDNVERFLGLNQKAPERQRERRHISLER